MGPGPWELGSCINQLTCDASGLRLAAAGRGRLALFDARDGRPLVLMPGHGHVLDIDLSPDGRWVAAGCEGDEMYCLDAASASLVHGWKPEAAPRRGSQSVRFSRDGSALAIATSEPGIRIWRCADWSLRALLRLRRPVRALDWFPGGERLAVLTRDGVRVYRIEDRQVMARVALAGAFDLVVSPEGTRVAVTDYDSGHVRVFGASLRRQEHALPLKNACRVRFSRDGRALYGGSLDGAVLRWDLDHGARSTLLKPRGGGQLHGLDVEPQSGTVFYGGPEGRIHTCGPRAL